MLVSGVILYVNVHTHMHINKHTLHRLSCALSRGSGMHTCTSLAMLLRERDPVESCSCSGTSAMPLSSLRSLQVRTPPPPPTHTHNHPYFPLFTLSPLAFLVHYQVTCLLIHAVTNVELLQQDRCSLTLSLSRAPSPPSLTPGEDAVKFESLPDDVVIAKAISVLRSIFGDQTVPEVILCTSLQVAIGRL